MGKSRVCSGSRKPSKATLLIVKQKLQIELWETRLGGSLGKALMPFGRVCTNSWPLPKLPLQGITQSPLSSKSGKPYRWTPFCVGHHHSAFRMNTAFGTSKWQVFSRARQRYWLALCFVPCVSLAGQTLAAFVWEPSASLTGEGLGRLCSSSVRKIAENINFNHTYGARCTVLRTKWKMPLQANFPLLEENNKHKTKPQHGSIKRQWVTRGQMVRSSVCAERHGGKGCPEI